MPEATPLPPERISTWLASVDDAALRQLDEQLLLYLFVTEDDPAQRRDVAAIVAGYLRTADAETSARFESVCRAMGKPVPSIAQPAAMSRSIESAEEEKPAQRPGERQSVSQAGGIAALRERYATAVSAADDVWQSAATEGMPDVRIAWHAVDDLADAISCQGGGMLALTALSPSGDYTFTHMVNVSILSMALARTLGIDGHLLRVLGLAALTHDIGKVRTPSEILYKPQRLSDAEFRIIERHTIDGAEILRRTPGMPTLAPVVAFEHHLRMDGSGYPAPARRYTLNLGTMLCSIADVYDAMRSHRTYQASYGDDRILNVLQRRSERPQFDPILVQRFAQLLGIPPGKFKEPWPSPND